MWGEAKRNRERMKEVEGGRERWRQDESGEEKQGEVKNDFKTENHTK